MKKAKRILVGLKTPEQAADLADVACRLAGRGASLLLVHIVELAPATPIDAEIPALEETARKGFRAAERVARRAELKCSTLILHARTAGDALIEVMRERGIELAVLGYHHKKTLGEKLLGTVADHIMRNAPCDILLHVPRR